MTLQLLHAQLLELLNAATAAVQTAPQFAQLPMANDGLYCHAFTAIGTGEFMP